MCYTEYVERPLKNITITLPREIAKWARVYAAERDTSVSGMLGDMLRDKMDSESSYSRSMERFLSKRPRALRNEGERLPERDELHER
jgi:hypothetical protein